MRTTGWIAGAALAAVLTGCATTGDEGVSLPPVTVPVRDTVVPPADAPGGRGWLDDHATWSGGGREGGGRGSDTVESAAGAAPAPAVAATAAAAATTAAGAPANGPGTEVGLSAGSVDDNDRWDDYLRYVEAFGRTGATARSYDFAGRRIVRVRDDGGRPVLAATVVVTGADGSVVSQARTDASGRALVFLPAGGGSDQQQAPAFTATVTKGAASVEVPLAGATAFDVALPAATESAGPTKLDVLFLIDATGSMGDEIERLKANMISVAERIAALPARPDVRFGMTVYRDKGDLFLTRTFDFTSDVAAFTAALSEVVAENGGDTPEDVESALADAVSKPAWRVDDTASLVFLVADAPPHLDYTDSTPYTASIDAARVKGVKITPIASSGLDDQGEFVFRQLAQTTLGKFVFLTYGADGMSPGTSTPHHVDGYSTLALDDLVVQLVSDELAARS